jgi:hypothetical protein
MRDLDSVGHASSFSDRVLRLLERVEYRRADTPGEKQAIYRMRHDAYTRAGTIQPRPSGIFSDPYDEEPNAWLIAVYIDGELASSVRLHISANLAAKLPAMGPFNDIVSSYLIEGRMLIDASRFVSKLEYSLKYSAMPYITLRPTFLAEEYFDADFITAACLVEHQAFYRRMFGGAQWASPREYPNFNKPMVFVGYDCRARYHKTRQRFKFYQSNEREQARLFQRSSNEAGNILRAIGKRNEMATASL